MDLLVAVTVVGVFGHPGPDLYLKDRVVVEGAPTPTVPLHVTAAVAFRRVVRPPIVKAFPGSDIATVAPDSHSHGLPGAGVMGVTGGSFSFPVSPDIGIVAVIALDVIHLVVGAGLRGTSSAPDMEADGPAGVGPGFRRI